MRSSSSSKQPRIPIFSSGKEPKYTEYIDSRTLLQRAADRQSREILNQVDQYRSPKKTYDLKLKNLEKAESSELQSQRLSELLQITQKELKISRSNFSEQHEKYEKIIKEQKIKINEVEMDNLRLTKEISNLKSSLKKDIDQIQEKDHKLLSDYHKRIKDSEDQNKFHMQENIKIKQNYEKEIQHLRGLLKDTDNKLEIYKREVFSVNSRSRKDLDELNFKDDFIKKLQDSLKEKTKSLNELKASNEQSLRLLEEKEQIFFILEKELKKEKEQNKIISQRLNEIFSEKSPESYSRGRSLVAENRGRGRHLKPEIDSHDFEGSLEKSLKKARISLIQHEGEDALLKYKSQIIDLEGKINTLNAENAQVRSDTLIYIDKCRSLEDDIKNYKLLLGKKDQNSKGKEEKNEAKAKHVQLLKDKEKTEKFYRELLTEFEANKRKLQESEQQKIALSDKNQAVQKLLEELQSENKTLKKNLDAETKDFQKIQTTLREYQKKLDNKDEDLDTFLNHLISENEDKMSELLKENQELYENIENIAGELAKLETMGNDYEKLKNCLVTSQEIIKVYEQVAEEIDSIKEILKISSKNKDLRYKFLDLAEISKEILRLLDQSEQEETERDKRINLLENQLNESKHKNVSLFRENEDKQQTIEYLQDSLREAVQSKDLLERNIKANQQVGKMFEDVSENYQKLKTKTMKKKQAEIKLKEQLNEAIFQKTKLEKSLFFTEEELQKAQILLEENQTKNKDLEKQLNNLQTENTELRKTVAESLQQILLDDSQDDRKNTVSVLEYKSEENLQEKTETEEKLSKEIAKEELLKANQEKIEQLQREKSELGHFLDSLETRNRVQFKDISKLESENSSLNELILKTTSLYEQKVSSLGSEVFSLRQRLSLKEEELGSLKTELKNCKDLNEKNESEALQLEIHIDTGHLLALESLQVNLFSAKAELDQAALEKEFLESQISDLLKKIQELARDKIEIQEQSERIMKEYRNALVKIKSLELENLDLNKVVDDENMQSIEDSLVGNDSIRLELETKDCEIKALKDSLELKGQEFSLLKKELADKIQECKKMAELRQSLSKANIDLKDHENKLKLCEIQKKKLTSENEELKQKQKESSVRSKEDLKKLEEETENLYLKIEELETSLIQKENKIEELEILSKDLKETITQSGNKPDLLVSCKDSKIDNELINTLKIENSSLANQLKAAELKETDFNEQHSKLVKKLKLTQDELDETAKELLERNERIDEISIQSSIKFKELEDTLLENQELKKAVEEASQEINQLKAKYLELERQLESQLSDLTLTKSRELENQSRSSESGFD